VRADGGSWPFSGRTIARPPPWIPPAPARGAPPEFRGPHTYFGEMPRRQAPGALINGGRIHFSGDGLRTLHVRPGPYHAPPSPPRCLGSAPPWDGAEIERAGASARMTPTARASWAAWRRWKRRPASRSTPEPSCRTTPTGWSGRAGQVMADFKVGDIVQLRSGGPKMTVVEEVNHLMMGVRPSALCNWFAGSKNEQKAFPPAALILLDEDASERTE